MTPDVIIDDERSLEGAVHARNSRDGIRVLADTVPIGRLWLDHDLGGDDTIIPVVDHLAEAAANGNPVPVEQVIVHTANPVGAQTISRTLRRWGYPVKVWPATAAGHPLQHT